MQMIPFNLLNNWGRCHYSPVLWMWRLHIAYLQLVSGRARIWSPNSLTPKSNYEPLCLLPSRYSIFYLCPQHSAKLWEYSEVVIKDFIMHGLFLSGVEAKLKVEIFVALPDSGSSVGPLLIWEVSLLLSVPLLTQSSKQGHGDVFVLQSPGSAVDQWMTDFPSLWPWSMPIWEWREQIVNLNLRDCSARHPEVSPGLGGRGGSRTGTRLMRKRCVRIIWFPRWMVLGAWHRCIWFDITIQSQPLSYSRQGTDFSLQGVQSHLPPGLLHWESNSVSSADLVKIAPSAQPSRPRRSPKDGRGLAPASATEVPGLASCTWLGNEKCRSPLSKEELLKSQLSSPGALPTRSDREG